MKIHSTPIAGVQRVETTRIADARGSFARLFCNGELRPILGSRNIVQINHSITQEVGTIRGMHFQKPPHAEMKFIRCLRGRVYDVALDLRKDSPTFLQWHAQELSAENGLMLIIPEGCAHGFQVLEPESELLYLHTHPYTQSAEDGVRFDDPRVNINWPRPPARLSERDSTFLLLGANFAGLAV